MAVTFVLSGALATPWNGPPDRFPGSGMEAAGEDPVPAGLSVYGTPAGAGEFFTAPFFVLFF